MMSAPAQVLSVKANDMGFVSIASCFGLIAANSYGLAMWGYLKIISQHSRKPHVGGWVILHLSLSL
jgi:hypothetical protein